VFYNCFAVKLNIDPFKEKCTIIVCIISELFKSFLIVFFLLFGSESDGKVVQEQQDVVKLKKKEKRTPSHQLLSKIAQYMNKTKKQKLMFFSPYTYIMRISFRTVNFC